MWGEEAAQGGWAGEGGGLNGGESVEAYSNQSGKGESETFDAIHRRAYLSVILFSDNEAYEMCIPCVMCVYVCVLCDTFSVIFHR